VELARLALLWQQQAEQPNGLNGRLFWHGDLSLLDADINHPLCGQDSADPEFTSREGFSPQASPPAQGLGIFSDHGTALQSLFLTSKKRDVDYFPSVGGKEGGGGRFLERRRHPAARGPVPPQASSRPPKGAPPPPSP